MKRFRLEILPLVLILFIFSCAKDQPQQEIVDSKSNQLSNTAISKKIKTTALILSRDISFQNLVQKTSVIAAENLSIYKSAGVDLKKPIISPEQSKLISRLAENNLIIKDFQSNFRKLKSSHQQLSELSENEFKDLWKEATSLFRGQRSLGKLLESSPANSANSWERQQCLNACDYYRLVSIGDAESNLWNSTNIYLDNIGDPPCFDSTGTGDCDMTFCSWCISDPNDFNIAYSNWLGWKAYYEAQLVIVTAAYNAELIAIEDNYNNCKMNCISEWPD